MLEKAPQFNNENYDNAKLKARLVGCFGGQLLFWQTNRRSKLVYKSDIEVGAAFEASTSEKKLYEDVDRSLSRHILQAHARCTEMP